MRSRISGVIRPLSNGEWHKADEVAIRVGLSYEATLRILRFLGEFGILEFNNKNRRARITSSFRKVVCPKSVRYESVLTRGWPQELLEELRFKEGRVLFRDERFFLGHKYMLDYMHSTFKRIMGPAAKVLLYRYGEAFGYYLSKGYKEKWNLNQLELVDFLFKTFTVWGFGKFSGVVYNPKRKYLKASVQDSVEVASMSKANAPSCYFISGIFGGVGKFLFGENTICHEKLCEGVGDAACEFEVKPYFKVR
ncbi:MAG: V4R domain-containing protein [Candidatus Bathyarchaeia archaeon]